MLDRYPRRTSLAGAIAASNGDGASGTLTATETNPDVNEWTINSISGTWHSPNASYYWFGADGTYGNDNVFYYGFSGTSSSLGNGVGFTTNGSSDVVVFNNGGELIYPNGSDTPSSQSLYPDTGGPGYQFRDLGPATAAPWEPSDIVFISGALGFGLMQYRRIRRKAAV